MGSRMCNSLLCLALLLPVYPASVSFAQVSAEKVHAVIEELDVKVPMRDGVLLSTNIYRPDAPGRFPALLIRTPYGNGGSGHGGGRYFAQRGYVAVWQDTRGRFESEGLFYPAFFETEDGLDTQKWVAEQPWFDGNLGTYGGSYVGMTQWMPALAGSPYVDAMFTSVPFTEIYTVAYQNGAFRMRMFTAWYAQMSAPYDFDNDSFMKNVIDKVNRHLPLIDQDTVLGWRMPYYRDILGHPGHDSYWEPISFDGRYGNIRAATYILAGWFDLFTGQNLKNFREMTSPSIAPDIRAKQRIIVGPWAHGGQNKSELGDMDYGAASVINSTEIMLRWFDSTLKGIDNGILDEPPVRIFVMGENVWRSENEWPLARTVYTPYYFHSGGGANTRSGDGVLTTKAPGDEPPDRYVYDPDDPVPSKPDSTVFDDFRYLPIDHSRLEGRRDILVYSTPPLDRDIEVTGPVRVRLHAASSAVDTDFTGKLLDVHPDGRAIYLCDGIIRASFRNGPSGMSRIEPGKVYEYDIDLWATSNVFKKGHRIRLEISSSNFPRFDRNLNTGGNFATGTTWVKADQTVYHDTSRPSHIILPVIPR